ncbi:MAG: FMN-binding glutamate synthase family protein [Myxococcota bacterium]
MATAPRPGRRWERAGIDRVPAFVERWSRGSFYVTTFILVAGVGALTWWWRPGAFFFIPVIAFASRGLADIHQTRRTVLRNFPVLGHIRYFFESIRPELRQYFVESDSELTPFSRQQRSIVYQRAKNVLDTTPFGTLFDVYDDGYEWLAHSLAPTHPTEETARVMLGEGTCEQPYSCSIFNISAMSYGSLSSAAIRALNGGAAEGEFFHNTGEGGVSDHHLEPGGDLCWQIGTGYFGCRTEDGNFDPERFAERAKHPHIKLIELKLSQGAKPGHGGILPGNKVTPEIARIRGVKVGQTVNSPPSHRAFDGPKGLLKLIAQMRELSGGKPVGFKLCVGQPTEFLGIVKAMLETGLVPDFVSVDGSEGGTGAAPPEFSNSVGMPLADGLSLVHNALRGAGLRDQTKIISAGKITSGFHVVRQLALGADACNSARGMMFALGCIQALKCNTNKCPVGVATQDPKLIQGLVVDDKARRVHNFHRKTIHSVLELIGAAGIKHPQDLRSHHVYRRVSPTAIRHLGEIYPWVEDRCLLEGNAPAELTEWWDLADADSFEACGRPN